MGQISGLKMAATLLNLLIIIIKNWVYLVYNVNFCILLAIKFFLLVVFLL